jgi:hypothetical protein
MGTYNFTKKFFEQISKKIWQGPSSDPTLANSTYFTQTCYIFVKGV